MADRTVWKFPLSINVLTVSVTNVVDIPKGAKLLHCAAQRNSIGLWYEIPDPEAEKEPHGFQIFGTGNGPIRDHLAYVGTALFADGDLVLHVYETTEKAEEV